MSKPIRNTCELALLLLIVGGCALASALLAAGPAVSSPPVAGEERKGVLAAKVDGSITSVVADYVVAGVQRAEDEGHQAFLLELNTPGGLDTSMRDIVQSILDAEVPVIVHVTPPGARATSAGALITFSAHVAAMAPATSIGAATPVDLEGGEVSDKVVNDAAAYAESVARQQGRNTEFAEDAVREGKAATAQRAAAIDAVDLTAQDRDALFTALDGRRVTLANSAEVTLRMTGAGVVDHEMGLFTRLLQALANPNLAFLFLTIGSLAVIYELVSPGAGIGGAIGSVLLLLGFFSLAVLPVTVTGILLLALAVALFVAELFSPGIGVFAGGGAIALLMAGLFLFEGPFTVDQAVLWPVVAVMAVGTVLAGRLALRARKASPVTGGSGLVGQEAAVHEASGEQGRARVEGSWWNVHSTQGQLSEGQRVRVVDVRDLTLVVESVSEEEQR